MCGQSLQLTNGRHSKEWWARGADWGIYVCYKNIHYLLTLPNYSPYNTSHAFWLYIQN